MAPLATRHLLEAAQGFDLVVELWYAIHGIEHHHVGSEPAPAICRCRPALRIGIVHPEPSLDPELAGLTPMLAHLVPQQGKLLLGRMVGWDDRHPAVADLGRPLHCGIGDAAKPDRDWALHGRGHDVDFPQRMKLSVESDKIPRPEPPQHLYLLGLACAARLPALPQRLVLNVVPSNADAKPKPATTEQIDLGRL